jgi:hypothetical protein
MTARSARTALRRPTVPTMERLKPVTVPEALTALAGAVARYDPANPDARATAAVIAAARTLVEAVDQATEDDAVLAVTEAWGRLRTLTETTDPDEDDVAGVLAACRELDEARVRRNNRAAAAGTRTPPARPVDPSDVADAAEQLDNIRHRWAEGETGTTIGDDLGHLATLLAELAGPGR